MGYERTSQAKTTEATIQRNSAIASQQRSPVHIPTHPILQMQAKIGNQAISRLIQAKMKVGQPGDIYEQEADRVADSVMRMPDFVIQRQPNLEEETAQTKPVDERITPLIQRQAEEEQKEEPVQMLQRQTDDEQKEEPLQAKGTTDQTPEVTTDLETRIQSMRGGGQPLPASTQTFFETRFGYDLSGVRVHTDYQANDTANSLNAQAFTVGQDVFFGAGRYEPHTSQGKWLLAHELTHTIQQQPQPLQKQEIQRLQAQKFSTENLVQSQTLTLTPANSQIQRLGFDDILNWVADKATNIPGFTLLTVIIGRNPINNRSVERNAVNLTRGLMGLVPGGDLIFKALQENGILDRVFAWLTQQIAQLNITWDSIKALFQRAWKEVSITDGFSGAFDKIKGIFNPPYERIKNFAISIGKKVIEFIKEAILKPVAQFAQRLPGYPLLCVILGKNPITGEPVQRNAANFVGGILDLVPGGQKMFKNLQESKAIERATAWLNEQISRLNLTWENLKGLFSQAWDALSINDIISPLKAFEKIQNIFSPPFKRIGEFAIAVGKQVLEFIFEGALKLGGPLGGAVLGAIRQAGAVFSTIIKNPAAFAGNLVKAVKQGFSQFSSNILTHLKTGLTTWLFGALATAGIALPEQFDLKGIVSLVLQVLGVTYARLRGKLVDLIGEKPVAYIEKTFDFLVTIATQGLAAAWEKIVEFMGSLEEMVIGGIKDWVVSKVVTAAITKLISMFNPAGAIIQAIISVYNTIAFFFERAQQIAVLVSAVTKSISNIAAGAVGAAANFIEMSMGKAIPVMLGFLARFIGLGNVTEPIQKVIHGLQEKVWGTITKMANFIVSKAKGLFGKGKDKDGDDKPADLEHDRKVQEGLTAIDYEEQKYVQDGKIEREDAEKVAATVKAKHPVFKSITVVEGQDSWDYYYVASPGKKKKGESKAGKVNISELEGWRPSWRTSTDKELAQAKHNQPYFYVRRGKIRLKKTANVNRRHIVAFEVIFKELRANVEGKTYKEGFDILKKLGYQPSKSNNKAIVSACKKYLRDKFNDPKNVWVGDAEENQELGRQISALMSNLRTAQNELRSLKGKSKSEVKKQRPAILSRITKIIDQLQAARLDVPRGKTVKAAQEYLDMLDAQRDREIDLISTLE